MNSLEETREDSDKTISTPLTSMMKTASSAVKQITTTNEPSPMISSSSSSESFFDFKFGMIIVLILLIVLLYLGINVFNIFGDSLQSIANITGPTISKILAAFGFSAGQVINVTADVASDTIKTGTDIAEGVVQNVGNLMIDASEETDASNKLKKDIENSNRRTNDPVIDNSEDTIQKSISSGKQNWCLVGEYQSRRGCVLVTDSDKCLSGQVFPNQQMCLNPTFTQ
jgi:hypothetical protein|tara:strand:- start:357 stop:1037 length:681 start_codon:yes stop_codon:yes gene_type:complete